MTLDRRFYDLDGGQISALHFGPKDEPIKLVFLHANGFNAQSYRAILEQLPLHSVSLDLRGHGFSTLPIPSGALKNFDIFRDDVLSFMERYIDGPVMIGGHSLGGAVSAMVCEASTEKIQAFIALDPPTMPSFMRGVVALPGMRGWFKRNFSLAKKSGSRRSIFPDREFMYDHYKKKRSFEKFQEKMMRDYIEGGTRAHKDGVELTCEPDWEARIYIGSMGNNLFRAAKYLPPHRLYIQAIKGGASTPTARAKISHIAGKENVIADRNIGHLFPLEDPDFVAGHMSKLLKKSGLLVD